MMATEATSEIFATTSTTPDHELNQSDAASANASSTIPTINGIAEKEDPKQDADPAESNIISAEVSVSGGSDTEASKAEATKTSTDGKGHLRTDSKIKKPTSFKAVSVNKTFLAAKTSGTTTPAKLGDKTSSTTTISQAGPPTTSLRPRLIAKTGSGLRDASSRTSPAAGNGKLGAPDGSAVWNKNRPAPAPEPKSYTDEELQQRYGIHMATRIQKDDGGKQANWADIDDDDDDWAPDSMEWSDGTKVTLPQVEEPAPPPAVPEPAPIPRESAPSEPPKAKSPAPIQAIPSPTIKSSGLGSGRAGLVLKGAVEKPTLVAKPPVPPAPVKSPWAALPPVEKVAPIEISTQTPQNRFSRPDPHGFSGMPPPPAKEIAADDFTRTWRDGTTHANRELFDSKSGRYEPVNDNRRGQRNDSRQPALLQRPHQADGPAEPSPAFQTHRASAQEGYGRRRTSSNVSGGSGHLARRLSRGHDMPPPPHDTLRARRGSLAALSDDHSSQRNISPAGQNNRNQNSAWQNRASPTITHASVQSHHGQSTSPAAIAEQPPAVPYEDPVQEQAKIMRASRELAIKRRQEAEAKEEAEKRERLRIKLEALGPPPDKKSKKDTPKEEKVVPVPLQIQSRVQLPSPTSDQVGESVSADRVDEVQVNDQTVTSKSQEGAESRANGDHILTTTQPSKLPQPESQSTTNWQNNSAPSSDRFGGPWAQQQPQHTSRNVWGPPTNDRSLGNGTFNQDLGSVSDMVTTNPGPIGPPGRGGGLQQRGSREQHGNRPAPIGPPARQTYSRPASDPRVATSGWANAVQVIQEDERRHHDDAAKASAERREMETQGLVKSYEPPKFQDTWRQVTIGDDGRRSKVVANHVMLRGEDNVPPTVKAHEDVTSRPIFEERSLMQEQESSRHHNFDAIGHSNRQAEPWSAPRGSRFFPSQDIRLENKHIEEPTVSPFERPGSPLPPPPTMPGHPVYGESAFPQVHLPKPAPIVKLPPVLAPIGPPPRPTSFAAAVAAPIAAVRHDHRPNLTQDIRRQEPTTATGWQDRINTLIGRKPVSPPRTYALQVDSASKNALELPITEFTATVSLPGSSTGDISVDNGSIVSKPAAEECFEEQEMGSLPTVKVPVAAPVAAWNLSPAPKISARSISFPDVFSVNTDLLRSALNGPIVNNSLTIQIKIPGHEAVKRLRMTVAPQHHSNNNRRNGGVRGGSRPGSSRGGRGRDASSTFTASPVPEGGRGFSKASKSSNWTRTQR